jgi:very-short-patch-repair endonuclease
MIERYGAEYSAQSPELMQKSLATKAAKSEEEKQAILDQTRATNLERFGATHHMKLPEQQLKVRETHLKRHGTQFPAQNEQTMAKIKIGLTANSTESNVKRKYTIQSKYGVDTASQIGLSDETRKILTDSELFTIAISGRERASVAAELGVSLSTLYKTADKYNVNHLFKRPLVSSFEREVADWLTDQSVPFITNDRIVLQPQELDFFIPSLNVAIECDGLYWHSEMASSRSRRYHSSKHERCREQGIQLITIFEDEWRFKRDRVLTRLAQVLKRNDVKIAARQCKLIQPDIECNNHIRITIPVLAEF